MLALEDDEGRTGSGEASPLDPSVRPEKLATVLAGDVRGLLGQGIREAWAGRAAGPPGVNESARARTAAIDTAVADLASQADGAPFWRWLAGGAEQEPAATVPVNAVIDAVEAQEAAREAATRVREGYSVLKVKVGDSEDVARVRAVREAAGREVTLRVDANGAWRTVHEADARLEQLAAFGIAYCEEPLASPGERWEGLAALAAVSPVAIAVDESCRSLDELRGAVEARACAVAVLKPSLTGLLEAARMAAFAREWGLGVVVTSALEAGVGTCAALHLAASVPPPREAAGLATLDRLEASLVDLPPIIERGAMHVPRGSGLGVRLDTDALRRHAAGQAIEVTV